LWRSEQLARNLLIADAAERHPRVEGLHPVVVERIAQRIYRRLDRRRKADAHQRHGTILGKVLSIVF
jgi:hypothetical protein